MTPFIVAELSANHLGSLDRALAVVGAAADAGADAIKLQTWAPDTMCLDRAYTIEQGAWRGHRLFDLYREAHTPWDWHPIIFDHARSKGLIPFSAAFDRESVDFLETLGVDRHKVASFELTDIPLIRYMASKGKPMILSTGMATIAEIDAALDASRRPVTLLRCTSAYPAKAADANLSNLRDMASWPCFLGLSDHTLGIGVAVAATALGVTYIEKHLTLKRSDGGLDAGFSMEPDEFKAMVQACRQAAASIGVPSYGPGKHESTALRRSLWVTRDTPIGTKLEIGRNVATARPALGLPPSTDLTGKVASRTLWANTPLTQECLG